MELPIEVLPIKGEIIFLGLISNDDATRSSRAQEVAKMEVALRVIAVYNPNV